MSFNTLARDAEANVITTDLDAIERLITRHKEMRQHMLAHYRADSCIAASRALIDALRLRGVAARPLVSRALVVNPYVTERVRASAQKNVQPGDVFAWIAEPEGYGLGLGFADVDGPHGEEKWEGHLAVYLPEHRLFVDLTLDQASRPQHGIALTSLVMKTDVDIERGGAFSVQCGDSLVFYYPSPLDHSYERAPDWYDAEQTAHLTVLFTKTLNGR